MSSSEKMSMASRRRGLRCKLGGQTMRFRFQAAKTRPKPPWPNFGAR